MQVKYKVAAAVLLSIVFVACNPSQNDKAPIPMARMEKILIDIHIAEIYSTMLDTGVLRRNEKNLDSLAVFYKDVLKHHNVSLEQFHEGMEWYKAHPAELDSCYKHMIEDIASMQGADTTGVR